MIPTLFGRATAVLGDHARLQVLLVQLRNVSDAPIEQGSEESLVDVVREFRQRLSEHFVAEEHDEYFGTLVEAVPQLRSKIEALCAEHVQFLEMVRRLTELAESADRQTFRRALRTFLERFNAHERAENMLLQEFFSRSEWG